MHVMILGSGVIGVTSAYYLARAGHQVSVLDRQPAAGLETSYANAGQISPGYASPWAAPGVPLKAIKWLLTKHAPLAVRPDGSLLQLQWMWQMLRNCNSERYEINKERMVRLAEYSRDCLKQLRADTGISYEDRQQGTLQVFRNQQQLDAALRDIDVLRHSGVAFELIPRYLLARVEPALANVSDKLTGALYLPHDETGDCHLFTQLLALEAEKLGVIFRYGVNIEGLESVGNKIASVVCDGVRLQADRYVMALGSYSTSLLKGIVNIPVYPVKGYSITAPIINAERAPVSTVLDETYKVALTRFDHRIRIGGMAEVVGFDKTLKIKRRRTLEMVVNDLFPGAIDDTQATFWTGLRPMTPDGTPLVGATPIDNLYLNTGHGTLGWTMACGSAQLLADMISGRNPQIRHEDLSVSRY